MILEMLDGINDFKCLNCDGDRFTLMMKVKTIRLPEELKIECGHHIGPQNVFKDILNFQNDGVKCAGCGTIYSTVNVDDEIRLVADTDDGDSRL